MKPSAPRGRADSARLAVAALLAVLLHLALAQAPMNWRPPAAPLASPIQISLLPRPVAPPAAVPGPAAPPAAAPIVEVAPEKPAPVEPEEPRLEPPKPSRSVVTTKVAKSSDPIRWRAKPQPPKPKPSKPKPAEPKPTHSRPTKPAEPASEPPIRLAASQSSPALSSATVGGGSGDGATGGASAFTSGGTGGASSAIAADLRPLPGNPPPRYPSLARRRGEEGRVLLRLTVNAAGHVEGVSIARSSGYELLDQEAQRTVARWRFQAPSAERMVAQVPITFRLRD